MPIFKVLSRVDAYVDYVAEVEADTAEQAVDLAYEQRAPGISWRERSFVEFDARHIAALDADGNEIEGYSRGKG